MCYLSWQILVFLMLGLSDSLVDSAVLKTISKGEVLPKYSDAKFAISLFEPVPHDPNFVILICGCLENGTDVLLPLASILPNTHHLKLVAEDQLKKKSPQLIGRLYIENGKTLSLRRLTRADERFRVRCQMTYTEAGSNKTIYSKEHKIKVVYSFQNFNISRHGKVSVKEQNGFTVSCQVQGDPRPTLIWYKDGIQLVSNQSSGITLIDIVLENNTYSSVLSLQKAKPDNSGTYKCLGKSYRMKSSMEFSLQIKYFHGIHLNVTAAAVYKTDPVSIQCKSIGVPPPQLAWTRSGKLINNSTSLKILETYLDFTIVSTLQISKTFKNHSGIYFCTGKNIIGEETKNTTILVYYLTNPELNVYNNTTKLEGETFTATCKVEGNPLPQVSWLRGNYTIRSGIEEKITGNTVINTLKIKNVRVQDAGKYVCKGFGARRESEASFSLRIQTKGKAEHNKSCQSERNMTMCIKRPDSKSSRNRYNANSALILTPIATTSAAILLLVMLFALYKIMKRAKRSQVRPKNEGLPNREMNYEMDL